MSWLKLARLRCCSPLRKSSCDFRRCHAQMLDTSLQLASRVTSAMHVESSNSDDPFAKVKSLISEMIARLEEEASAGATHKAYGDRDAGCC